MRYRLFIAALGAVALSGCATARDLPGCREAQCIALQERQVLAPDMAVRPLAVREDSRCPLEAECIWEGRLVVEAELEMGHETTTVEIETGKPLRINAGLLSIVEVAPDMSSEWAPIAPEEYRLAFRFVPDLMETGETGAALQ